MTEQERGHAFVVFARLALQDSKDARLQGPDIRESLSPLLRMDAPR
jgi:hypothetical protein